MSYSFLFTKGTLNIPVFEATQIPCQNFFDENGSYLKPIAISTGYYHSMVLTENFYCFGFGERALGIVYAGSLSVPTCVQYFVNNGLLVKSVHCGGFHTLWVVEESVTASIFVVIIFVNLIKKHFYTPLMEETRLNLYLLIIAIFLL